MKTTVRIAGLLGCGLTLSTCALLNRIPGASSLPIGGIDASDVIAAGRKVAAAKEKADRECESVRTKIVSWPEERAIGGAISVSLAQKGKGVFADFSDKDPKALKKRVDDAKGKRDVVKLSASESRRER